MATLTAKVLADFTTSLATAIAIGGTTATLQSATDDDGIALVSGRYFFTLDGSNSNKEHISCDLAGTSLTNIKSVSRQGTETSGVVRAHRIGTTVALTDFAHIKVINDLVAGTTNFNASVPLGYDGAPSITTGNQFATKTYVDGVAVAGAPNADTTTKGIVELATQAEILAKTATGGTGASLVITPDKLPSTLLSDYKVDTGAANAYVITPDPAITAYTTGQIFSFKAVNANTTTSTLNVNGLGAKTIKTSAGSNLVANDILAGQIVVVEYDGTNLVMISPLANTVSFTAGAYPTGAGANITGVIHSASELRTHTAGSYIIAASDSLAIRLTASYAKAKEIYLAQGGTVTVSFALANGAASEAIYGRIYKNGSAFGTERTVSSTAFTTFTEDLTFATGDLVQLYFKGAGSSRSTVKEFRILATVPVTTGYTIDTNQD